MLNIFTEICQWLGLALLVGALILRLFGLLIPADPATDFWAYTTVGLFLMFAPRLLLRESPKKPKTDA